MIIDFHTHAFPDPIAPGALSVLESKAGVKASGNGTVDSILESMDNSGVDFSVLCPVSTKASQVKSINSWIKGIGNDRIIPFGTLFPGMDNVEEEAKMLNEAGVRGIKLHPDYQSFFVDDEVAFPMYDACAKYKLMILFHAGVDIGLPPPVHATPKALAYVANNWPELKIITAHMGGYMLWDDVRKNLVGKDLFFDTAYYSKGISETLFLDLMREHGSEKVLFATDFPWLNQKEAVDTLNSWGLTESEKSLLFYENARNLLGL